MIARYSSRRFGAVAIAFVLCMVAISLRLVWVQAVRHEHWKQRAGANTVRVRDTAARRGRILDRNGVLLAATEIRTDIGVSSAPRFLAAGGPDSLALWIGEDAARIRRELASVGEEHFVLRKGLVLDSEQRSSVRSLPGVSTTDKVRRSYPHGDLAENLLGRVTIGGEGATGLERVFESRLGGRAGQVLQRRDNEGRIISRREISAPVDGEDLLLTLDSRVQSILERQIDLARVEAGAHFAQGIVLEPRTGEVLGLAQMPLHPGPIEGETELDDARIAGAVDAFEPGSTFKVFTAASLLSRSVCDTSDTYDGQGKPGQYRSVKNFGKFRIRDVHPVGVVSLRHAFVVSSNIVFATAAQNHLQRQELYDDLRSFGFGERTGSGLAGETVGVFASAESWSERSLPTIAIGQEIGVSLLQLAAAYAAVVGDGHLRTPHFDHGWIDARGELDRVEPPVGRGPVVPASIVPVLRALCSEVVTAKHGTGSRAAVDGLDIAGKTGTAQISDGTRYIPGIYNTSFVGFAPSRDPQLLIAIVLHRVPSEEAFGGNTAAPCAGSVLRSIAACTEHLDGAAQHLDEVRTVAAPSWLGLDANAVRNAVDNEGWMVSGKIPADGRVVGQVPAPGSTMVPRTRIQIAWHRESR